MRENCFGHIALIALLILFDFLILSTRGKKRLSSFHSFFHSPSASLLIEVLRRLLDLMYVVGIRSEGTSVPFAMVWLINRKETTSERWKMNRTESFSLQLEFVLIIITLIHSALAYLGRCFHRSFDQLTLTVLFRMGVVLMLMIGLLLVAVLLILLKLFVMI